MRITADAPDAVDIPGVLPFVLPLTKVDVASRRITGACALAVPDAAGEVCDVAQSVPYFEALAKRCLAESGGRKVAPLRVMHQPTVAGGNVVSFALDRDAEMITCEAVITDDAVMAKVLDGTLCCLSMGGKKRIIGGDPRFPGCRRYIAKPSEISLADLGAIPGSQITLMKVATVETIDEDGEIEWRPLLNMAQRADVSAADRQRATAEYGDVTYADATNKKYPIDTEEHIRAAWSYINQEQNAAKYSADEVASIKRKIVAAWTRVIDEHGPPSAAHMHKVADPGTAGLMEDDDVTDQDMQKAVRDALGLTGDETLAKTVSALVGAAVDERLGAALDERMEKATSTLIAKADEQTKKLGGLEERLAKAEAGITELGKRPAAAPVLIAPNKGGSAVAGAVAELGGDAVLEDLAKNDPKAAMKLVQRMTGRKLTLDGFQPIAASE